MRKIKTFWLNIGALDRDMDLTGRQQILKALSRINVEVRTTFNYFDSKSMLMPGVGKVYLFKMGKTFFGKLLLTFKQQFLLWKNRDVDCIFVRAWKVHETLPVFFLIHLVLGNRSPKFFLDLRTVPVDGTDSLKDRLNNFRFRSSIKIALTCLDGITVISEKLRRDIIENYQCREDKITVWKTGVDPTHFDPSKKGNLREKLNISDRFIIMYHGIFSLNRGLQEAIKAISILKDMHPKIFLLFLGKGQALPELEKLIDQLGLQKYVYIHPPVPFTEVPEIINCCDCGILPFPDIEWWNTSGPLKLNEYLAMGKPVALTDIEAHRAVVQGEPFSFFSKDEKPESLAKTIEKIMERNDLHKLNQQARDFAVNNLSWNSQAKIVKNFIKSHLLLPSE